MTTATFLGTAEQWNGMHPHGTWVRYWPIFPPGPGVTPIYSRTRSKAWRLGSRTPVVMLESSRGGVALSHLEVVAPPIGPAR